MKTFRVYKHPVHGWEAVKVGFSWPAFIFGVIWMLICRLWKQAAIVAPILISLRWLDLMSQNPSVSEGGQLFAGIVAFVFTLGIAVFVGLNGNLWRRQNLKSRGYDLIDTVQADNKDAALAMAQKEMSPAGKQDTNEGAKLS